MAEHFDLLVLGGGSAGLAAARRAAKHGARAALIEDKQLGGTCVNVGCVPKKVMWHAAQLVHGFEDAADYGFELAEVPALDWGKLVARREAYLRRLNGIYASNLDKDGVTRIQGRGRFVGPRLIDVDGTPYSGEHVVIATGATPIWPRGEGVEHGIDSDGFFALTDKPRRVAVVGAGYIAVELAGVLNTLGGDDDETHLIYRRGTVLRSFDALLGDSLLEFMADDGVQLHSHATVSKITKGDEGLRLDFEHERTPITVDAVVFAIGRAPNTADIGLEDVGIATDGMGRVTVNAQDETSADGVYALGDVVGPPELTPVAIAKGRCLSDRLFGGLPASPLDIDQVPTVIFAHPPIGTVGLSEAEARDKFGDSAVRCYTSTFRALYYGVLDHKRETRFKLVCVGPEERVVGVHLIGLASDEILQGFAVAVRMGATKADLDATLAIHPTSAEELVTMT